MKSFTSALYYIFFFTTGVPLLTIALLVWALSRPFDKRLYYLHLYTQYWTAFALLIIPGWKITVIGRKKIDNSKAVVFVSNHQSEFDIMVVSKLFAHFKWISKSEVFKVPIIGWNMRLNKYVELKRGDRKSIVQMIKDSVETIKKGSSIFIFPEGTRSKTGVLRPFSSGAFVIAKRAKIGIQPIAISGTKNILEKDGWMLNYKANVTITILDVIPYETIKDMETSDIANMVRKQITEYVKEHTINK